TTQTVGANRRGPQGIHRRGDGICRLDRQRCDEHKAERGPRQSGDHLFGPAGCRADTAYRGTGAMGEYGEAAPNETKEGRAENRRVEVKVLVNKGIAGS